ncbi:MAG: FAD-binding protein [Leucobacter sp.]
MRYPDITPDPVGDGAPLAKLTTMRVGGPADRIVAAHSAEDLVLRATELWRLGEPWLLLGGGSNTVVCDEGFPGTVLLVRNTGIARVEDPNLLPGRVRVRAQAGHDWDHLVKACVDRGWAGIEALSGIPGLAGAAPVQNIGAYGQELSNVLHSIEFLDAGSGEVRRVPAAELALEYRDSAIKRGDLEGVVLSIDLVLSDALAGIERSGAADTWSDTLPLPIAAAERSRGRHGADPEPAGSGSTAPAAIPGGAASEAGAPAQAPGQTPAARPAAQPATDETPLSLAPVLYAQLAAALGVEVGDFVPVRVLRDAVLRMRASKGMVLDEADHDSWSSGSFFTNPIVSERFARELPSDAPRFPMHSEKGGDEVAVTTLEELEAGVPLRIPEAPPERRYKLSAAWLIEHAGVPRGFRLPGSGAAISSKHTLAITNRGAASAADVAQLARFVVQRVQQEFGVILEPEPNLYGLEL